MKRVSIGFFCLTLVLGLGVSRSAAQSSLAGNWVGGYETSGNYIPISVRFDATGGNLTGAINAPTRRTAGAPLDKIEFTSPNVKFEWPAAGPVAFAGQLNGEVITGSIGYPGGTGAFHLLRTVTLDPKVLDRYVGDFQIGPDRYISIARASFPQESITFVDHDSSNAERRIGELFPISGNTFVAGSGRWIEYPVEVDATFVEDGHGQVTALKWKPRDSSEILGKKVALQFFKAEDVRFRNGNVTLAGTLTLPASKGPHPAVVLIMGSDPNLRMKGWLPRFFAQHGIAALTYDKRGNGESTGDLNVSGFDDLAADAAAGIRFLRSRQDIKAEQIGLWGISQGGWLAPLAATKIPNVAFVILHAGPAVTPREQGLMELRSIFPAAYPTQQDQLDQAVAYQNLYYDALHSDAAYDQLQATYLQLQARGAAWAWNPGTKEDLRKTWFRLSMDYDPLPVLRQIKCPVLAFFGGKDGLVPPDGNAALMETTLKNAGNKDVTVKILPGVNHLFHLPGIGIYGLGTSGKTPPGYYDVMIKWLKKRVDAH